MAYGRALEDYLVFCEYNSVVPKDASREHISLYVHNLANRPSRFGSNVRVIDSGMGLSNATMQQRLTVVRLFYDFLIEQSACELNPVGRGKYTPGRSFGGYRARGLIPRYKKLPWIPNDEQWLTIAAEVRLQTLRTRLMFAMCYDAGLRREELCSLKIADIDPSQRLIHIRAETTKNRLGRVVPYSEVTSPMYVSYLRYRRTLSRVNGSLFLSESRRNYAAPITIWTWSKVVKRLSRCAGIPLLTPHTLRHLRLTDLARAGWDIHDIAQFAGHRNTESPLTYIHLSGHDLKDKLARSMNSIHEWRLRKINE
jgi:site-specific recombinase XerD